MRKRKTGINGKRAMSVLTAAVMLTAEVATVAGAAFIGTKPLNTQAIAVEKKLQFGKGSIATQDRVLYGKKYSDDSLSNIYDSGNGKYIVLDASKDNTGHDGAMFVLSEDLWAKTDASNTYYGDVHYDYEYPRSNYWQDSDARLWCINFANVNFGENLPERTAIRAISKDDNYTEPIYNIYWASRDNILIRDEVFFLSVKEAYDYVSHDTSGLAASFKGGPGHWWFRTANASDDPYNLDAGAVLSNGEVCHQALGSICEARPAFNIETDHILFSADSEWDKPNDDELVSVTTGDVDTWRLTLKITGLTAGYESVAQNEDEPRKILLGGYTKSETGDRTSVMVTDADETEILYYGKLHEEEDNADFTLPDALCVADWGTDYKVFLVREDIHEEGSFASDLAGEPIEIDAPEGSKDVTGVTLNHNTLQLQTGSSADLTATVEPGDADDDTVVWSSSNEVIATVNNNGKVTAVAEGSATITATATNGTDDTSDDQTATCTVTVKKPESTVTKAPEAKTLTYNGSAQALVTAGTAEGGEMQYALGTKDAATEEYTASIPTATDAGTYYVWYKASGNPDYEESEPGCVEVTIREDGQPDNDEGNINVETHKDEGAPDCGLEVPDDTLDSLLTEEEKERLNSGEAVLFYLDVSSTDPSETDKSLIESKLKEISSDAQVGMFFDISFYKQFYKQVGNASEPEKITDLNGKKVNVLIDVPKELQNAESGKTRIFYVVRIHNGVAEIIAESTKTPIPVESDKFSTYAILYEDVEKSTGSSYEHHHHICEHGHIFNYHVFQEPTTETDGYAGWVCDRCGIQDPDHVDYVGPTGYIVLSAFPVFNDTLEKNIAAAPENGTVSISTKRWMSVRRGVLEALAARPDVTLSISFAYENEDYVLTIKGSDPNLAGFTASGDLFYGFIYLGNGFGLEKKTAEVPQS